jgi:solute carrier family 25 folate transporter 32
MSPLNSLVPKVHPLDLIKTRFAVNEGIQSSLVPSRPQYTGVWNAVRTIHAEEGFRGLYRGVTPNVLGASTAWGLYFLFYNAGKSWFQNGDGTRNLGPAMHMSIAAQSGALTLLFTNPIWVVKTRLCLQYAGDKQLYATGIVDALRRIYSENGIRGWYKGGDL